MVLLFLTLARRAGERRVMVVLVIVSECRARHAVLVIIGKVK